jgi:hypothetical protein
LDDQHAVYCNNDDTGEGACATQFLAALVRFATIVRFSLLLFISIVRHK